MIDERRATSQRTNSKKCRHCTHSVHPSLFDGLEGAPDGLMPFCQTCVARNPWLARSACVRCGSSRLVSKFPGGDTTQPCTVCAPAAQSGGTRPVLLALESADLVRGAPKTAAELLEDIGYFGATRSDVIAAGKWLAAKGYERGVRSAEKVFRVGVEHLEQGAVSDLLDALDDLPSGRMTVTEFLAVTGVCDKPGKADLNEGARWLRDQGFATVRVAGRRAFDLGDEVGDDTTYADWAAAWPACAEHIDLPRQDIERYTAGVKPPRHVRLAMSALIAGLPPYEGPGAGS